MTTRKAAPDRRPASLASVDLADTLGLSKRYREAQARVDSDCLIKTAQENHAKALEAEPEPEPAPGISKPVWFFWGILLGVLLSELYQLARIAGEI